MPIEVIDPSEDPSIAQEEQPAHSGPHGDDDHMEDPDSEVEAERPRGLRDPGLPSASEIAEHNLTHLPPRPWCAACVKARGRDKHSRRLCGAYSDNRVPRVRLDYCFLTEKAPHTDNTTRDEAQEETAEAAQSGDRAADETSADDSSNLTVLVMQESPCRSVWPYTVQQKGIGDEWISQQSQSICADRPWTGCTIFQTHKQLNDLSILLSEHGSKAKPKSSRNRKQVKHVESVVLAWTPLPCILVP